MTRICKHCKQKLPLSQQWDKEWDDNDNTIHTLPSPYHSEQGVFEWRIGPVLVEDTILYQLDGSDSELLVDTTEEWFHSVEEAKAFCEEKNEEIEETLEEEAKNSNG